MLNGSRMKSGRKRSTRDFYETPLDLANAAIYRLREDGEVNDTFPLSALDAGCGTGVWGKALNRLFTYILGIDVDPQVPNGYYDDVYCMDYLSFKVLPEFDLIIGNPPYSLAEDFIRHSFDLLTKDGRVFFLLRLSFLEGIKRCHTLFKEFPIKKVYVCARRPSFFSSDDKHHTTDTLSYAMFLWQKGYDGMTVLDWLDWEYSK